MKKKLKAKVIQVPAEVINRIDPAELEKYEACAAESVIAPYTPTDFFSNPVDSYQRMKTLYPYQEKMDLAHEVLSDNGMVNTIDGRIKGYNDSRFAAIFPAVPIAATEDLGRTSTLIVNTLNNGLRYCGIGEDGSTHDLGPVTEACIIGNAERPSALLVPICNPRAIAEGYNILHDLADQAIKKQAAISNKRGHCAICNDEDPNCPYASYPDEEFEDAKPEVTYTPRGWYI